MATKAFRYQPLEYDDSIRLLHLEPSLERDADLRGALHHATLSNCDYDLVEPYTALSYVWGNPAQKGVIHLGGRAVEITTNLDTALRDMREKDRLHRIWADALCIDQSNIPERNQQVSLMGRIYSTAHHTVIHLGNSTADVGRLFGSLQSQTRTTIQGKMAAGQIQSPTDVINLEIVREDLLARPWFRRVWVFQELVLSRDAWVQCGHSRTRWHHFCDALGVENVTKAMLLGALSVSNKSLSVTPRSGLLENMNMRRYDAFEAPLYSLLSCRRGIGATDARNIVFGHLGVVSDREKCDEFIKVDYGKDLRQVYIEAAWYFLNCSGLEELLYHAMDPSPVDCNPDIPSWCPRWSNPQTVWEPMYRKRRRFGGGDDTSYIVFKGCHQVLLSDPPLLAISGFQVAKIETTSVAFPTRIDEQGLTLARQILRGIDAEQLAPDDYGRALRAIPMSTDRDRQTQEAFAASFVAWSRQAMENNFKAGPEDVERVGEALLRYSQKPGDSPLGGKRLAITSAEDCVVVPPETKQGDVVVVLAHCYKHVIVRFKEAKWFDHLDGSVREALEHANKETCANGPICAFIRPAADDDGDDYDEGGHPGTQSKVFALH
ncbi:Ankyrin and het domain-containing protein [Pleurostoma richardsiae]|uniref:Ankyrin and het domain-containing protein n=1 Tax=Pleurostoma richardsiae TaxID=41990 RepID=A0AA38VXS6_9PEZI|nr:Ankyrin and het domain-containing protein [Pleurostoma richardsiae]